MPNNLVCLCGSTRFLGEFGTANVELTKRGLSVITISMCLEKNAAGENARPEDNGLKELLDLVHLNKIMRSDIVLVVGDGYIGRSTAREILWAEMQGKNILMAEDYRNENSSHGEDWTNIAIALVDIMSETSVHTIICAKRVLGL